MAALAASLNQLREAVGRDVTALSAAGIVKVRNLANSGPERVTMVTPLAKKIFVEL